MSLITTPFGHDSTAKEVVAGIDLDGKHAIVTGGASGIGVETARALVGAGADVTIAVRDLEAGARTVADIEATEGGAGTIRAAFLDLTDRASIQAFVDSWDGPLDILINNAGVMASPLTRTSEGWELQFATNHLGHFALATGLHEHLAAAGNARIVSVSSSGHHISPVVFEDFHFERRDYDPWAGYGQSKTANVLFAVEATRRWAADGITANALMPGGIWTALQRYVDDAKRAEWQKLSDEGIATMKTTEQGAATSVLLATSPQLEGIGGRYFDDCNETPTLAERTTGTGGVRDYALDPENARQLWDVSVELVKTPIG